MRWLSCPVPASSGSDPRSAFICDASCHVRAIVSPIRPMPCESDPSALIAPMSWSTSSAAIVSRRIRDSANATSSGTRGLR